MTAKEQLREVLKNVLKFAKANPELFTGFIFGFVAVVAIAGSLFFRASQTPNLNPEPSASPEVVTALPSQPVSTNNDVNLPVTYLVQAGDSSWKIAEAFYGCGESYVQIEKANNLESDAYLEIGQKLVIPELEQVCSKPHLSGSAVQNPDVLSNSGEKLAENNTYEVLQGDCLWSIALEQTGNPYNWVAIYEANKDVIGNNPDLIYPQTQLIIPDPLY